MKLTTTVLTTIFLLVITPIVSAKPGKRQVKVLTSSIVLQTHLANIEKLINNIGEASVKAGVREPIAQQLTYKTRVFRGATTALHMTAQTAHNNQEMYAVVKPLARLTMEFDEVRYATNLLRNADLKAKLTKELDAIETQLHVMADCFVGNHPYATVKFQREAVAAEPGIENWMTTVILFDRRPRTQAKPVAARRTGPRTAQMATQVVCVPPTRSDFDRRAGVTGIVVIWTNCRIGIRVADGTIMDLFAGFADVQTIKAIGQEVTASYDPITFQAFWISFPANPFVANVPTTGRVMVQGGIPTRPGSLGRAYAGDTVEARYVVPPAVAVTFHKAVEKPAVQPCASNEPDGRPVNMPCYRDWQLPGDKILRGFLSPCLKEKINMGQKGEPTLKVFPTYYVPDDTCHEVKQRDGN